MAERRMFAKTIIDSDAFLDMPLSTQALYFHLSMRADDDGFINNHKKIQRMIGSSDDDLKILIAKSYIITFDSGVLVIKHWKMHNYIQSDRYKPTVYQEEKCLLNMKENKAYTLPENECIHNGYITDTQVRLGKDSIVKDSIVKDSIDKVKSASKEAHIYFEHEALNNTFLDFVAMRKKMKNGAMTDRAITMMINKLNAYKPDVAIALLEKSILNNWKDIYPDKNEQNGVSQSGTNRVREEVNEHEKTVNAEYRKQAAERGIAPEWKGWNLKN